MCEFSTGLAFGVGADDFFVCACGDRFECRLFFGCDAGGLVFGGESGDLIDREEVNSPFDGGDKHFFLRESDHGRFGQIELAGNLVSCEKSGVFETLGRAAGAGVHSWKSTDNI